ncbi:MAG: hypothetical protein JXA78_05545 [Anaerolineales bacterium]|nr:hypothetical protein [Anaerolineales bacterium]
MVEGKDFLEAASFGRTVALQYLPYTFFQARWHPLKRLAAGIIEKKLRLRSSSLAGLDPLMFRWLRGRRYSVVIGVDPYGIILADYLNRWIKRPLAYISFEIISADEVVSSFEEDTLRAEKQACAGVALLLIQDEERADLFCQERAFPFEKVVMVPVAPLYQDSTRTNYFREILGICSNQRIVLYMGALEAWASRDEFAEMVSFWPGDYCLVVHTRAALARRMQHYLEQLTETGKIYISTQPVGRSEMATLVSSADFGLAPYKQTPDEWWTGKNIYHIGLSSGKVSYYAMCGCPILARRLPVFEREFSHYQCGKIYDRLSETGRLLDEMQSNYAQYSAEACRFYRERLDPANGIRRFCDRLMNLSEQV